MYWSNAVLISYITKENIHWAKKRKNNEFPKTFIKSDNFYQKVTAFIKKWQLLSKSDIILSKNDNSRILSK